MGNPSSALPVSIVVPTCGRDQVLIDTLSALLALTEPASEILVVDQSVNHTPATARQLEAWHEQGRISLHTLPLPSIPAAMNTGLRTASRPQVLFLDDDIRPREGLVAAHQKAMDQYPGRIIAGRVIQPWDDKGKISDAGHRFNSDEACRVSHFMGGNVSVPREKVIEMGGFDENFIGAAYRFEKEFADRWTDAGHEICFEPEAAIEHLKAETGGTRRYGNHWSTPGPEHSVGAYYYILRSPLVENKPAEILNRALGSVRTRHHLAKPWYIPVTLMAEIRGLLQAWKLDLQGPRLIQKPE